MSQPLTVLSEDEQFFKDTVLSFAKDRIGPHVSEMDETQTMRPEILRECTEMGLLGIEIPEEYGGAGGSFFDAILAIEALAMVDPSVSVLVDVQNTLVINAFLKWGTDEQRAQYFPRLAKGELSAYALSEASSGSDAFALKTKAEKRGDHWVLNGTKLWITNAKEADIFIVMANANPEAGYRGITSFIVEKSFPGFRVGKKEDKLGIRASSTCEIVLDDCIVPAQNVLGEVGKGYKVAIETLNEGRIGIGAQMVGLAQGAFDHAIAYTKERKQFGKRICDFQGIQFQLADLATDIECARLLVYNSAKLRDAGRPFLKEAAMTKLHTSIVAERVASKCIELFGGVGFTREFPAEKYYRDAKIGQIYEGTSNMQRMTIAKMLLND